MTDFITHPATVYALIGYGAFVTAVCIGLHYLWQLEKDEAERAEKAAEHYEKRVNIMVEDLNSTMEVLMESRKTNKAITDTNAHLSEILTKAYIRNAYGQLQRYDDWAINGDKKPKPREKKDKDAKPKMSIAELGDHFLSEVEKIKEREEKKPQPMTRAEYVHALLKEAAESGQFKNESWPMSAMEQMDDEFCNQNENWDNNVTLSLAIGTLRHWDSTKQGWDCWYRIAHSEAVRNFKPKTKWVK